MALVLVWEPGNLQNLVVYEVFPGLVRQVASKTLICIRLLSIVVGVGWFWFGSGSPEAPKPCVV